MQFKLANRRLTSSSEALRSRRRLLDVEIRSKNRRVAFLSTRVNTLKHQFQSTVRRINYIYYDAIINESINRGRSEWHQTHQRKITDLRATTRSDAGLLNPDSVIVNLSDYQLSDIEKAALANGLKFCLPPRKLRLGSYLANFELLYSDLKKSHFVGSEDDELYFRKSISEIAFSSFFNYNMNRSKYMNIPREQHKALQELSKNTDIIITVPDKGSGVVILNKQDYVDKMENIPSDATKFKVSSNQDIYDVSRKIERKVRNYLRDHLKKPGLITEEEYKKMYPNGSHIGIMYGLPKVHKNGHPMRPVCSAIGTSTYELGKYVSKVIKPAASNTLGTDLENTFSFVNQIKNIDVTGAKMVSFDVRSLFTNIPLKKAIKVCLDRLYRGRPEIRPAIPEKVLEKLLQLCLYENTFIFNGTVYQQIDGVAMGSSLGLLLSNIDMAYLEEEYFLKEVKEFTPTFYRRYVDDTFCLMKQEHHIKMFLDFINSIDSNIQFDIECERNNSLPFLVTTVSRNSNNIYPGISTKVKATDKGLFYNFSSFIPNSYRSNLIYCLVYRVFHIASSYSIFFIDVEILK